MWRLLLALAPLHWDSSSLLCVLLFCLHSLGIG